MSALPKRRPRARFLPIKWSTISSRSTIGRPRKNNLVSKTERPSQLRRYLNPCTDPDSEQGWRGKGQMTYVNLCSDVITINNIRAARPTSPNHHNRSTGPTTNRPINALGVLAYPSFLQLIANQHECGLTLLLNEHPASRSMFINHLESFGPEAHLH